MFKLPTVAQEREKEKERERICKSQWTDTKRHAHPQLDWTLWTPTSNWQLTDW